MKSTLMGLILIMSLTSHAGGGTGQGFIDPTVLSCGSIDPVQEGVASLSLYITESNTVKIAYSNHVNDFNVSFEPVKIIETLNESAKLSIVGNMILAESQSGKLRLIMNPLDLVTKTGDLDVEINLNGKVMTDSCMVSLNNLRNALKL